MNKQTKPRNQLNKYTSKKVRGGGIEQIGNKESDGGNMQLYQNYKQLWIEYKFPS